MDDFTVVPFNRKTIEPVPYIVILDRKAKGHVAEFRGVLALLKYLGDSLCVEIEVNKAATRFKLKPLEKKTAYSQNVRTDMQAFVRFGGASTLINDYGYKPGIYNMISSNPLVFEWGGLKTSRVPRKAQS